MNATAQILRLDDLRYQGRNVSVEVSRTVFTRPRTIGDWEDFSKKDEWKILDLEMWYQILRRLSEQARNLPAEGRPTQKEALDEYVANSKQISLLTRLEYYPIRGSEDCFVEIKSTGLTPRQVVHRIPNVLPLLSGIRKDSSYDAGASWYVLDLERPKEIPTEMKSVLETLLGAGWEQAGQVLRCFNPESRKPFEFTLGIPTPEFVRFHIEQHSFDSASSTILYTNQMRSLYFTLLCSVGPEQPAIGARIVNPE